MTSAQGSTQNCIINIQKSTTDPVYVKKNVKPHFWLTATKAFV